MRDPEKWKPVFGKDHAQNKKCQPSGNFMGKAAQNAVKKRKLMPIIRIDDRSLQPGPLYRKARELYWDFAHS